MPNQVHGAFNSRHVRYRAVPRTNRTPTTVNTHNHSATSNRSEPPAFVPSLPWLCSCVDAPPGECTDVATPDGFVLPPGLPPPQETQQRVTFLADVSQPLLAATGVLTRNHPHVRADLLAARKPARSSDDQRIGQSRNRPHARMGHQSQYLGSLSGFPLDSGRQLFNRRIQAVQQLQQLLPSPTGPRS